MGRAGHGLVGPASAPELVLLLPDLLVIVGVDLLDLSAELLVERDGARRRPAPRITTVRLRSCVAGRGIAEVSLSFDEHGPSRHAQIA